MWSDKESESDYLNFGEVSQLAVEVLNSPNMLPVSLGVFGNWGAGKSSLLNLIKKDLQKNGKNKLIINFDAWLYQGYDDARAALLEVIATELNKEAKGNEGLLKKTKNLLARINHFRVFGLVAEGAALGFGIPTGGMLAGGIGAISNLKDGIQDEDEYKNLTKAAKDAKKATKGLLNPASKNSPPQHIDAFRRDYGDILNELNKTLIVIIDNLDRCLPTNAIHTLEAIRLFLFLPNTAFIIGADEEMIRSAVAEYFKGASHRHQIDYLDKLIQVPFRVPKAGVREIRSYLFMLYAIDHGVTGDQLETLRSGLEKSLQQSWKDTPISKAEALKLTGEVEDSDLARAYDRADRIAPILASSPIIHGNPRIVKRLLNVVKMRSSIAQRRSIPLDEGIITKLVIFERCAGADATADLYRLIDSQAGKPELFSKLEDTAPSEFPKDIDTPKSWSESTAKDFILEWAKLEPSLNDKDLRAAVYLSRETMPIGSYVVGLSPKGRETLEVLVHVKNLSSPGGKNAVQNLPLEDQIPVMEGIIEHLRQTTDWNNQPEGFSGACLLARHTGDAAIILKRFITDLGNLPPWMNTLLKNENWFKEK